MLGAGGLGGFDTADLEQQLGELPSEFKGLLGDKG